MDRKVRGKEIIKQPSGKLEERRVEYDDYLTAECFLDQAKPREYELQ